MERLRVRIVTVDMIKVEVTGWWTGFGDCVIWPLRVEVCYDCSTVQGQRGEDRM